MENFRQQAEIGTMGRKTIYSEAIAEAILGQLEKGTPLAEICRQDGMPAVRTVNDWAATDPAFGARFARARVEGWDAIAADCVRIADDETKDVIADGKGGVMQNSTAAARARLRIETRLKLLAKWDPKRYGERIQIEEAVETKLLGRADAVAALRSGAVTVDELMQRWTKPVEAIEEPKTVEPAQPASGGDFVDIDD